MCPDTVNQPVLELRDVTLRRSGRALLRNISWRIEPGTHWAVVGPNGSGKTTLLKVLVGYEWITSGSVVVMGRRFGYTNLPDLRTHIGWMSPSLERTLRPTMTVRQIVLCGCNASLEAYPPFAEADEERAERRIDQLELRHVTETPFHVLSHGERCRCLIARALMVDPSILILDEPFAGLDMVVREEVGAQIDRMAAMPDGPAIILVTHHVEEISGCITHALAMRDGTVVARGAVDEVLTPRTLSMAFGVPIRTERHNGRLYARLDGATRGLRE